MRKSVIVCLSAVLALASACGGSDGGPASAGPTKIATTYPTLDPTPTPTSEVPDGAAAFGTSADFSPGVGLAVGNPSACDMTEDNDVNQDLTCVAFKITVSNDTKSPLGLSSLTADMTSGGQDAGQVYAPKQKITGTHDLSKAVVPVHGSTSFDIGFAVQDTTDLILDIGSNASGKTFRYAGSL